MKDQQTKKCKICGLDKLIPDDFSKDKRNADGLVALCKTCSVKRVCKWKSDHPKKYIYNRRKAAYKIEFDMLWESQNGMCKLCGKPMLALGTKSMSVTIDHDRSCCSGNNSCGKCVRGLIHSKCNRIIGNALDDIELLKNTIIYLEKWQGKPST